MRTPNDIFGKLKHFLAKFIINFHHFEKSGDKTLKNF